MISGRLYTQDDHVQLLEDLNDGSKSSEEE